MINKIPKNPRLGTAQVEKMTAQKFNELLEYQKLVTLQEAPVINWNMRKGYNVKVTLTGSRTLAISQLTPGDYGTIEIIQKGTGSYTLTLPTGSKVSGGGASYFLSGSPTINIGGKGIAIFRYYSPDSNYSLQSILTD